LQNSADWPEKWKTIYYKSYPRLAKIDLSRRTPKADFFNLIENRQSRREFLKKPISLEELSILLRYSCGENTFTDNSGRVFRAQPSGGARYPVEIYPLVIRGRDGLDAGLYHYNVQTHQLDVLLRKEFKDPDIDELFTYPWVKNSGAVFLMSAVFWRTQNKYGERGYRYALFEAGHIGQNLYLGAEALGLKCCALGGTNDEVLERLLDIDGINEALVYAVTIGR
jgi:SagB-type dehydrogenase family enzyme